MTNLSPRKQFLNLIAPRWRIPRCPVGNMHNSGLCMGSSIPDDIGRRYFYVCRYTLRFVFLIAIFNSATRGNWTLLNVRAASKLVHLSCQRRPANIYGVHFKYSPRLWLRVQTFRQPLRMDWQILRLWSVLIVKPKIEVALKQWSMTAVSHLRDIIRVYSNCMGISSSSCNIYLLDGTICAPAWDWTHNIPLGSRYIH